ncbi:MAG: sulfatase [Candidatus Omnitrophica bacterium]|nr:sulfatase [Candidatus Omnitrophota bacterium]
MKTHRFSTILFGALFSLISLGAPCKAETKPNIVFFLVDDMGWQDTSEPFHTEATELNRRYQTPNMERLADRGMKFTQAYACSLCSPTRVSLMTGMNAARHRVTNWTLRKDKSPDPEHPDLIIPRWNVNGLSPVEGIDRTVTAKTLPMFLQEAGYRTIHVGKAHWGAEGTPGADPTHLGFDVNIAGHCAGGPGSYWGLKNFSAAWRDGDRIWDVPGLDQYHGKDIYLTEALTLEANRAMEEAVAAGKPFYLYMSHYAIHAPWEKDDRFYQKYKDQGLPDLEATYASMIEGMDKSLGDILANIDRLGIGEDTIVLFMSDNGAAKQVPRNLPLRGHKLTAYEGGIRVPLMVKWPGVTSADSVSETPVIIEDIFPTLLEMAGVDTYEQIGGQVDGISFVPSLKGSANPSEDRPVFWHYPHCYDQPPFSAIRRGDWKLIYFYEDQHSELYNLAEDISESQDLLEDRPDIAETLTEALHDYLVEVEANIPSFKESRKRVPLPGEATRN